MHVELMKRALAAKPRNTAPVSSSKSKNRKTDALQEQFRISANEGPHHYRFKATGS